MCKMYCLKQPLNAKRRPKIGFQDRLSLNVGQKYCRMLQESILQYFRPSLSYHLSLRSCFSILNDRLRFFLYLRSWLQRRTIYFDILCLQVAKALTRLYRCDTYHINNELVFQDNQESRTSFEICETVPSLSTTGDANHFSF